MRRPALSLFAAAALAATAVRADAQTNFTTYVSVGDSLAAGFESNSLVETHQNRSVPALIARQAGVQGFQQPLISEPGIPPELTLVSLVPAPLIAPKASSAGAPPLHDGTLVHVGGRDDEAVAEQAVIRLRIRNRGAQNLLNLARCSSLSEREHRPGLGHAAATDVLRDEPRLAWRRVHPLGHGADLWCLDSTH